MKTYEENRRPDNNANSLTKKIFHFKLNGIKYFHSIQFLITNEFSEKIEKF
jgi:hypothetical protein